MPKLAERLTSTKVDKAKPGCDGSVKVRDGVWTLADGGGLLLRLTAGGTKSWQVRYKLPDGTRGGVVIGDYPAMGLAAARSKADEIHLAARTGAPIMGQRAEARAIRESGLEAVKAAEAAKAEAEKYSFKVLSEEWLEFKRPQWADQTYTKARGVIRTHLQPEIGDVDMRTMRKRDVVNVLKDMVGKKQIPVMARLAARTLQEIAAWCTDNSIREDDQVLVLDIAWPTHRVSHVPAVTEEAKIGPLIRAIRSYEGLAVRNALMLGAWTTMRPGIVASARWEEMDLDRGVWAVPGMEDEVWESGKQKNRMKTGIDHVVSLPTQAVAMLREMQAFSGGLKYVFPPLGLKNEHLHRDSMSKALRDMGFAGKHTPHGFRAMLRTVARDRLKIDIDVLEAQLAHVKKDAHGGAYDRARFDDERRKVMQLWADYLDELAGRE